MRKVFLALHLEVSPIVKVVIDSQGFEIDAVYQEVEEVMYVPISGNGEVFEILCKRWRKMEDGTHARMVPGDGTRFEKVELERGDGFWNMEEGGVFRGG
jgi:hypothetical protein